MPVDISFATLYKFSKPRVLIFLKNLNNSVIMLYCDVHVSAFTFNAFPTTFTAHALTVPVLVPRTGILWDRWAGRPVTLGPGTGCVLSPWFSRSPCCHAPKCLWRLPPSIHSTSSGPGVPNHHPRAFRLLRVIRNVGAPVGL